MANGPNFRFQPSLNIAAIAQLLAQRPVQEEQLRNQRLQQQQQRFSSILDTVRLGASLAEQASMAAQRRQAATRQAELDAVINRLAEIQRPTDAPAIGPLTQPQEQQRQALETATKIAPELAARQVIESRDPRPFRSGDIDIRRLRDPATGKIKDFIVNKPEQTVSDLSGNVLPPEKASQLEAGFAPGISVQGSLPDGTPIVMDKNGKFDVGRVPGGRLLPKLTQAPPTSINLQASVEDLDDALSVVQETFSRSFVGPIQGRLGNVLQAFEPTASEERAQFISAVNAYRNAMIKAITGAQMSEPEARRIMKQMPNENMSETDFLAKLKLSSKLLRQSVARKVTKLEKAGFIIDRQAVLDSIPTPTIQRRRQPALSPDQEAEQFLQGLQ